MNMYTACQIALKWAFCFSSSFFVIRLGKDLYGVTATLDHGDDVVVRCDAQPTCLSL